MDSRLYIIKKTILRLVSKVILKVKKEVSKKGVGQGAEKAETRCDSDFGVILAIEYG